MQYSCQIVFIRVLQCFIGLQGHLQMNHGIKKCILTKYAPKVSLEQAVLGLKSPGGIIVLNYCIDTLDSSMKVRISSALYKIFPSIL